MKKNGFTVMEVLITIGLLSLIGTMMAVGMSAVIKSNNKKNCEKMIDRIESASLVCKTDEHCNATTAKELKDYGLLVDENLLNPTIDNATMDGCKVSNGKITSSDRICKCE